jgi:hypothetical protein
MSPLARLLACFVEPATDEPAAIASPRIGRPACAAVVGAGARAVLPVAAATAGELRVRADSAAAIVAVWSAPGSGGAGTGAQGAARTPSGAATPAARRLAAGVADHGGVTTACGRLAWVGLPVDADAAAHVVRRLEAQADVPVTLAVCGPRPAPLEPVLADRDVALAVLPVDADRDLRALALAGLPCRATAVQAPLPPGPPRWAALVGLARLRSLPEAAG